MSQMDPKKEELNAMMKRLGLLGMETADEAPAAPAGPVPAERTPVAPEPAPEGFEVPEQSKESDMPAAAAPMARKPSPPPSVGPEDLSPMMDRLKRLDLSTFRQ